MVEPDSRVRNNKRDDTKLNEKIGKGQERMENMDRILRSNKILDAQHKEIK